MAQNNKRLKSLRIYTKIEAEESLEISSGTPNPRGAESTMSKARVKGDETSFIGNSKCQSIVVHIEQWRACIVSQRIASQRAVAECRVQSPRVTGHASLMFP